MKTKLFANTKYAVRDSRSATVLESIEKDCIEFAKFYFGARKDDCFYESTSAGTYRFYIHEAPNTDHCIAKVTVLGALKAKGKETYRVENWYAGTKFFPKGADGARVEKLFAL